MGPSPFLGGKFRPMSRWSVLAGVLVIGCGDNGHLARLDEVAPIPSTAGGAIDRLAFDRDNTPLVIAGGELRRYADGRWRRLADQNGDDIIATDFGTETDWTLLVTAKAPSALFRIVDGELRALGGTISITDVREPVEVPSKNHYAREAVAAGRSYVLAAATRDWVETPPLFFSRPRRNRDGVLYAMTAAGVQKFESDGTRTIARACTELGQATCTDLVFGGIEHDTMFVGAGDVVIAGEARLHLPGDATVEQIAAGDDLTVVLARSGERWRLFAIREGSVEEIDDASDRPSARTQLAVDGDGTVHVATTRLSRVMP